MNKMWITRQLPMTALLFAICSSAFTAKAQYYYKDIIGTGDINLNYLVLRDNKVSHVTLTPASMDPSQNLVTLEQTVYPKQNMVVTYTKVPDATESWLKSYYNAKGLLIKTVDSSADVVTTSYYEYGPSADAIGAINDVRSISSNSVPVNDPAEKEVHKWTFNNMNRPVQMLKIKNDTDTTLVTFVVDENGNIGEEKATHKNNSLPSTYYYYDTEHRLTDVAKFNVKANRILPSYMFEYNTGSQLAQMIVVPAGSNDYQTWKYSYNPHGLKLKDECYNKRKELVATIEYKYTY